MESRDFFEWKERLRLALMVILTEQQQQQFALESNFSSSGSSGAMESSATNSKGDFRCGAGR